MDINKWLFPCYIKTVRHKIVFVLCFVFIAAAQITMAYILRFEPEWDVASVFYGAVDIAESRGLSYRALDEYFAMFPNNWGLMVFMAGIFRLFPFLGFTGYFMVYAGLMVLSFCAGLYALFDLIARKINIRYAFAALLIITI